MRVAEGVLGASAWQPHARRIYERIVEVRIAVSTKVLALTHMPYTPKLMNTNKMVNNSINLRSNVHVLTSDLSE